MKPQNALLVVTLIVLLGEAFADLLANNIAWSTGICVVAFATMVIVSIKKSNRNAK